LHYYTPRLRNFAIQNELTSGIAELSSQSKYKLIWMLSEVPQISNDVILSLLEKYQNKIINASMLGYVFKLIHQENLPDVRIVKKLKELSKDKNGYVRNMTQKMNYKKPHK
jgi:hypothetical protein